MSKKYAIIAVIAVAAVLATTSTAFSQHEHGQDTQMQVSMSTPHMAQHGKTVLIHISSGDPKDPHQVHAAMMGTDHALMWRRSGFDVVIFLDVEGVLIGAEKVPDELKPMNDNLKQFIVEGGRVIACSHCVLNHGLTPDDMLPSIEIDTHPYMNRIQDVLRYNPIVLDY